MNGASSSHRYKEFDMKRETQTVEFKQSWHDEYLKWICGFANAQGGKWTGCMDNDRITACVADELEWRSK